MKIFDNENIQKIADNIYLVIAPLNGQFPYCHGFLFTGEENILIDAGADENILSKIDNEIGIDTLVISHSHPDHIRRWKALDHRRILIPAETPDAAFNIGQLGERFTGTRERGLHWAEVFGREFGVTAIRKPDGRFSGGEIFDNGTSRIEAIHSPGHLEDHYCFFEHVTGTLITTDIDFTTFGPWYGNPESRIKLFKESIRRVMSLPYSRVCTSHKMPHEGDASSRFNAFLMAFDRQKGEVYDSLGSGKTLDEITKASPIYYNKFMDPVLQYAFEEHMVSENLEILIEEGAVVEDDGRYIPVNNIRKNE